MKEFPTRGYVNINCKTDNKILESWSYYKECEKNNAGLYEINFEYDDKFAFNEEFEGTQVAGHPVIISLGVNEKGILELINVETDKSAPFYFRKQAYLMWLRVYGRYGSKNWKCIEHKRKEDHISAGKTYINRTCTKSLKNRDIILQTKFYFINKKKSEENLVSRTNMTIRINSNL